MEPHLEISTLCVSCDNCRLICPEDAVFTYDQDYFIDRWNCTLCHLCVEVCPVECIKLISTKQNK